MIPHRMLSNEVYGTGLKDRVTACRKRLRVNRILRTHADNQPEELFQETTVAASEFPGHAEGHPAMRGPLGRMQDVETSRRVDEQEVGIA